MTPEEEVAALRAPIQKPVRKSRFPSHDEIYEVLEATGDERCNSSKRTIYTRTGQSSKSLDRYLDYLAARGLVVMVPRTDEFEVPRLTSKGREALAAYRKARELTSRPGVNERLERL